MSDQQQPENEQPVSEIVTRHCSVLSEPWSGRSSMEDKPLSPRQERFVREYLVDHSGEGAARRAGYKGKFGPNRFYSRVASDPAYAHVRKELERRIDEMNEKLEITAEDVRRELWEALQPIFDSCGRGERLKAADSLGRRVAPAQNVVPRDR